ncbi:hypothetical protein D3C85_1786650 [compost metagenome]
MQEGNNFLRIEAEIEFILQILAGGLRQLQTVKHDIIDMEHQAVNRLGLYRVMPRQGER